MNLGGSVVLNSCWVIDNEAAARGGGVAVERRTGGGLAELQIVGSILGRNFDFRGAGNYFAHSEAVCASSGQNEYDDLTCGLARSGNGDEPGDALTPGDLLVADLMLSELNDFGGPTLTHLPFVGSPVIDVASGGGHRSPVDQRGFSREVDGDTDGLCHCDGGSVEVPSPTLEPPHDTRGDW